MPSPFPGMDPFLEDPEVFPDLHDGLIFCLRESLQSRLPEPYYTGTGRRVWVEISRRVILPDVNILRANGGAPARPEAAGGVATAAPSRTEPVVVHVPQDEIRENYVQIFTREGGPRLVTSIEVLSPTNKTPGTQGRDLYQQKQQEVLNSQVHLVEIDLLRGGHHTTAVPLDLALSRTGPFDYHVCVGRFDDRSRYHVYPIRLEGRLPEIAIPLLPGDPPVSVDLQAVFERCYDAAGYGRSLPYQANAPVPHLRPDQAAWATQVLREKGLLPAAPS